ncbi:hypothetical protein [Spirillospora sp. NPDC029432]|uniref:hypothetical protein n=1 Tax=Spirillospora sp. NPDC029432 TaxID=3154599 RepID=UPI00345445F7
MSILHHCTGARRTVVRRSPPGGPAPGRPPAAPPAAPAGRAALTAARTLASVLVVAAGLFYAAVAVKGVAGLLGPPPEMVTTAGEVAVENTRNAHALPTAQVTTGMSGTDLNLLLRPLALTGAALAGLLLLWSGARGLYFRRDQRRWRSRQATALAGCAAGVLAFAIGIGAADGSAAAYADAAWNGLEPIRPTAVLALAVLTLALLVPVPERAAPNAGNEARSPDR